MSTLPFGPLDPFPFTEHRTLAEVTLTVELRTAAEFRFLNRKEARRLHGLLKKANRFNPPLPVPDGAAA